jgi:hypothetical protein
LLLVSHVLIFSLLLNVKSVEQAQQSPLAEDWRLQG